MSNLIVTKLMALTLVVIPSIYDMVDGLRQRVFGRGVAGDEPAPGETAAHEPTTADDERGAPSGGDLLPGTAG